MEQGGGFVQICVGCTAHWESRRQFFHDGPPKEERESGYEKGDGRAKIRRFSIQEHERSGRTHNTPATAATAGIV
jgi:hypothetical protein